MRGFRVAFAIMGDALLLESIRPSSFAPRSESEVWGRSIEIVPGMRVMFHAPSGSGKTSVVSFVAMTRRDYSGQISLGPKRLSGARDELRAETLRRELAFVFQDFKLFPSLTVRENIELRSSISGYPEGSHKADDLLEELGILGLADTPAERLSRGEQQRVAIVRALAGSFRFLVLDEPFSHLDEANAAKAAGLIRRETEARSAAILYLDLESLDRLDCDRSYAL